MHDELASLEERARQGDGEALDALLEAHRRTRDELLARPQRGAEGNAALLGFALDNVHEGAFLMDERGRFVYVNKQACRSLGYTREEMLGGLAVTDIDPDLSPGVWDELWREVSTHRSIRIESRHRASDGRAFPVEIQSTWLEYDGRPYALALVHDVSERKQAEQERATYLHFLTSLDQVNRALQGSSDVQRAMNDVLDVVLAIFGCDRAFMLYPCDPASPTWSVPMERTTPAFPGRIVVGQDIPMTDALSTRLEQILSSEEPIGLGPFTTHPDHATPAFQSLLSMAVRPKNGKPWMFGIQQCAAPREWTADEKRLLREIGHRLRDALDTLLALRDLRDSEDRYRRVFESSPVSLWEEDMSQVKRLLDGLRSEGVVDLEAWLVEHPDFVAQCAEVARVVDVNRAALTLHRARDKAELLGRMAATFTDAALQAFRLELLAMWDGQTDIAMDTVVRTLTGELRDVTVYFSVCPGYESTLSKVLVSLVDITERKRAEAEILGLNAELEERVRLRTAELAASEARFRLFFERQVVGLAFTSPEKGWILVNDKLCEMLRYSREELARLTWAEMTCPDDLSSDLAQFERLLKGEIEGYAIEKRFVRRDGELVHTNLSVGCVRRPDGSVDYLLALLEDISERKRAEHSVRELNAELMRRAVKMEEANRELETSNKELEAFSYSVSHDLRAPLRAVLGFSQLLQDRCAETLPPDALELVRIIRENTVRMGQLIDDLLTFSRMSRQPLHCRSLSLERHLERIVTQLRAQLPAERRVEVTIQPLPPCEADPALITQLFTNLLSNAFKYTRPRDPAVIDIGSRPGDHADEVVYYVRDNGVGFDMRYADKLFGVFQRLHAVEEFEGIGAGLAIVARIALRHGGRVWGEGEVDRGATFYVALSRPSEAPGLA